MSDAQPYLPPPEPKPPHAARFCKECGAKFFPQLQTQEYCNPEHRKQANSRALTAGYKLYPLVMAWRIDRNKDSLSNLCALADQLANDEREIRRARMARIESYRV